MGFIANLLLKPPVLPVIAMILAGCDITGVTGGNSNASANAKCGITSSAPCRDSITIPTDRCFSRVITWQPQNLQLAEVCISEFGFREYFLSVYRQDLLKDTLYWLDDIDMDTIVTSGYAVYDYHTNGRLKRQLQWDLKYTSWSPIPDTILQMEVDYDTNGNASKSTEIFEGESAFTEFYNPFGNLKERWYYFLDNGETVPKDTNFEYYYYIQDSVLASSAYYSGSVKTDSAIFNRQKSPLTEWAFHVNGTIKKRRVNSYGEKENLLEYTIFNYDEQGLLTQTQLYNRRSLMTHVKNGQAAEWTPCAEPLEYSKCNLPE